MSPTASNPTCRWCSRALPEPQKQGRARIYCSDNCRKYAHQHRRAHQGETRSVIPPVKVTEAREKIVLKRPTIQQVLEAYKQDPNFATELTKTLIRMMKIDPLSRHYDQEALENFTVAFTEVIFLWYAQLKLPEAKLELPDYAHISTPESLWNEEEDKAYFETMHTLRDNIEGILGTQGALEEFHKHLAQWSDDYHEKWRSLIDEMEEKNNNYYFYLSGRERILREKLQFVKHQNTLLRYELGQEHAYTEVLLEWFRQKADKETRDIVFHAIFIKQDEQEPPKRYRTSYVYQLRNRLRLEEKVLEQMREERGLEWVEDRTPLESTGIDDEFIAFLQENTLDQKEDLLSLRPSTPIDFDEARRESERLRDFCSSADDDFYDDDEDDEEDLREEVERLKQEVADYDLENRRLFNFAFEHREEADRLRQRVAELERQNQNLVAKVRKSRRRK